MPDTSAFDTIAAAAAGLVGSEPTYTVSEINELVQAVLREQFPRSVWVRGEIQGFDQRKHRDTVSFTLAEKSPDSDDVRASVTAIMFREDRQAIGEVLRRAENAFQLRDGIEVRFQVDVDLWVKAGRYQLRVRGIDPTYTLGRLAQNRKRILDLLTQRGLLERNKRLPLPLVPLRVGLIAAQGSAGFTDFVTHLRESGLTFSIQFIDAAMQGPQVEHDVTRALRAFNHHRPVDVIVITRGGGAATDLSWFDRLGLAETVATAQLPVLTGLGHTHDTSVIDVVAHTNLKTPTDAAQFLIDRVEAFLDALSEAALQMEAATEALLAKGKEGLRESAETLMDAADSLVSDVEVWLGDGQRDVLHRSSELLSVEDEFLQGCRQRMSTARIRQLLRRHQDCVEEIGGRLGGGGCRFMLRTVDELVHLRRAFTYSRVNRTVVAAGDYVQAAAGTVTKLDPIKTIRRGFSIIRRADGAVVSRVSSVGIEELLTAQVSDGLIHSRVQSTERLNDEEARCG